jgi:CRP/FNR family cyclic AMP-dependent transcriptional regulator
MKETVALLKRSSLFEGLDAKELEMLAGHCTRVSYPKNTVLVNEGDRTDCLYVIVSGKVKVYRTDEQGNEVILAMLGPGEHFGEMALLDNAPRSANIITKTPCDLLNLPKDIFLKTFHLAGPSLNIMKSMSHRLRDANQMIKSLALSDVYGRVARLLTELSLDRDGKKIIAERLTHQEIANMVGSSREMVSIILKELTEGEFITVEDHQIQLLKKLPGSW